MTMRKINRLFSFFALVLACLLFFTSCSATAPEQAEERSITVFSWEDYLDMGYSEDDLVVDPEDPEYYGLLLDRFSPETLQKGLLEIFEEQTGIKVNYYSFATCEEMYNELLKDPKAVDLICPSEYMILKMKEEGLIQPYEMPENYEKYGSDYIKGVFDELGLVEDDGKVYATGFMWGTMGLIYNAEKYSDQDFESWTNLYDKKFQNTLTIKDSLRDSYIMAIAIVYKDELLALDKTAVDYNDKLFEIFNRTDKKTVDLVEKALKDLKGNLYGFEVDAGKSDLISGKIDVNFAWSGDAVYSMSEADAVGKELRYVVPQEGSNVFFDGWVMTKDAKVDMATEFLNFLADPDCAIRNMEYVGYTSCIGGDKVFDYVNDKFSNEGGEKTVDLSYFFGNDNPYLITVSDGEEGSYRHLYAQYADKETINRCAVMDNFTEDALERVNDMWNNVKLITLPTYAIVLIIVGIIVIITAMVVYKYKEKLFKRLPIKDGVNKNRKKYKVVKIEK